MSNVDGIGLLDFNQVAQIWQWMTGHSGLECELGAVGSHDGVRDECSLSQWDGRLINHMIHTSPDDWLNLEASMHQYSDERIKNSERSWMQCNIRVRIYSNGVLCRTKLCVTLLSPKMKLSAVPTVCIVSLCFRLIRAQEGCTPYYESVTTIRQVLSSLGVWC